MKTRAFVRDLIAFIDASEPSDWRGDEHTMTHRPTGLQIWININAGHPYLPHNIPLWFWHRWRVMAALRRMQRRIIIAHATSPTHTVIRSKQSQTPQGGEA